MAAKKAAKKAAAKKSAADETTTAAAKPAAKKATARESPAKTVAGAAASKPVPTFEEIATAAFLNHLRRRAAGLPDDPTADWLEAERVLRAGG